MPEGAILTADGFAEGPHRAVSRVKAYGDVRPLGPLLCHEGVTENTDPHELAEAAAERAPACLEKPGNGERSRAGEDQLPDRRAVALLGRHLARETRAASSCCKSR